MNTDDVIEKIKKAIRLARKTTEEGERETAMRLAKSLAEKNGIAFETLEVSESEAKAVKVDDTKKVWANGSDVGHICFILHEHFGVVVIMNRYGTGGKCTLSWFGCSLNIEIAKHVWHILRRESNKAWNEKKVELEAEFKKNLKELRRDSWYPLPQSAYKRKYNKGAFMKGFFFAIHKTLTEHPLRNDLDQFAAEKKAAEKKFEDFKAQNEVKNAKNRKTADDSSSIIAGLNAGKKVNLSIPCEGRESAVKMIA